MAYFYNNTKRLNSTKAAPSTYDTIDVVLKQGTSFINPVFILNHTGAISYNYMSFEGRYYWITDIISLHNDLWEIHATVDVLGTYKKHIQNTSAFVLYDSTANTQLPDTRLAIKTDCDTYTATATMPWNFNGSTGQYLIATTGDTTYFDFLNLTWTTDQRAGTGLYTLPYSSIQTLGFDLADWIFQYAGIVTDTNTAVSSALSKFVYTTGQDLLDYIAQCIHGCAGLVSAYLDGMFKAGRMIAGNLLCGGDALSNIKAAYWIPFTIPAMSMSAVSKPLALGAYSDIVPNLYHIDDIILSSVLVDVAIPWHYTDWRNVSCTEVMLYIPLIGCINIPSEVIKGNNSLQLKFALNLASGVLAVEVRCDGGTIGTYGCNTAMPILIGDSNINFGAITNTVTNAVTKNYAGAAVNGMVSMGAMATSIGGIGGGAGGGLGTDIMCICRCHDTSQNPADLINTIGTPTNQLKTLSGSGYCQTMNAQVNCTAVTGEPDPTQTEIEMINNYLNTGVYLE